jgi:hypothetical protein
LGRCNVHAKARRRKEGAREENSFSSRIARYCLSLHKAYPAGQALRAFAPLREPALRAARHYVRMSNDFGDVSKTAVSPCYRPGKGKEQGGKTFWAVFGQFAPDILLYDQCLERHSPCYSITGRLLEITGRRVGINRERPSADEGGLIQQQCDIGFYAVLHHLKD